MHLLLPQCLTSPSLPSVFSFLLHTSYSSFTIPSPGPRLIHALYSHHFVTSFQFTPLLRSHLTPLHPLTNPLLSISFTPHLNPTHLTPSSLPFTSSPFTQILLPSHLSFLTSTQPLPSHSSLPSPRPSPPPNWLH